MFLPISSILARSGPKILMPIGVRIPVESMSMRFLIGMVQAFDHSGQPDLLVHFGDQFVPCHRPSGAQNKFTKVAKRLGPVRPVNSQLAPLRFRLQHHCRFSHAERRRVGRCLRPAGLYRKPTGPRETSLSMRSCICSSMVACVADIPGRVVGM